MKTIISLAILAALAGCDLMAYKTPDPDADAWPVTAANDQAVKNAIITQSTLYPYHFVNNGAELTSIGESDLKTLVAHFRTYPGRLSIRRGDIIYPLYNERVQKVLAELRAGGVDVNRINVVDLPAGGDGMPSGNVIVIMSQDDLAKTARYDFGS